MAQVVVASLSAGLVSLEEVRPDPAPLPAASSAAPAAERATSIGEPVMRGAGCGNSARPDLRGPWGSNPPGLPDTPFPTPFRPLSQMRFPSPTSCLLKEGATIGKNASNVTGGAARTYGQGEDREGFEFPTGSDGLFASTFVCAGCHPRSTALASHVIH